MVRTVKETLENTFGSSKKLENVVRTDKSMKTVRELYKRQKTVRARKKSKYCDISKLEKWLGVFKMIPAEHTNS